jgi:hypothetical protein
LFKITLQTRVANELGKRKHSNKKVRFRSKERAGQRISKGNMQ